MLNKPRAIQKTSLSRATPNAFNLNTVVPSSLQHAIQQQSAGAVAPKMQFSQAGRGSFTQQPASSYVPPTKESLPMKKHKMKNGLTKFVEVKPKEQKSKSEDIYDADGHLNWETLEGGLKRLPCQNLIKKLKKGKTKVQIVN